MKSQLALFALLLAMALGATAIAPAAFTPSYLAPTAFGWMSIMSIQQTFFGGWTQVSATAARNQRNGGGSAGGLSWDGNFTYSQREQQQMDAIRTSGDD